MKHIEDLREIEMGTSAVKQKYMQLKHERKEELRIEEILLLLGEINILLGKCRMLSEITGESFCSTLRKIEEELHAMSDNIVTFTTKNHRKIKH